MIAFLEGTLVSGGTEAVVAVGGGIGLDVQLTAATAERLPAPGQAIRLWTHLAVRDDGWSLYGFLDPAERAMFRLLITVTGIGPKVALGMLSRASAADIATQLRHGDESALARLPGIGKKSAARLVVELGQRVPEAALPATDDGSVTGGGVREALREAVVVLGAMGLPPSQAEQALLRARQAAPDDACELETWVRAALRQLP